MLVRPEHVRRPSGTVFFGYVDVTSKGDPFYVGIGNLARVKQPHRNNLHTHISKTHGQVREIHFQTLSWQEACAWECLVIQALKTFYRESATGLGCNFTYGGDGGATRLGRKHSPETRQKMREWNIANSPTRGTHRSPEVKERTLQTWRTRSDSPKQKAYWAKERETRLGANNPASKLTEESAVYALQLLREGLYHREVAEKVGVSRTTITRLANGTTRFVAEQPRTTRA